MTGSNQDLLREATADTVDVRRGRDHRGAHRTRSTRMTQRDVEIPTPDGTCNATLHSPEGAGPWPAVIMYPDAGGVRPTFHEMATRLASRGYAVLLPDIYYRSGAYEPFDLSTAFTDPTERDRLMGMVASVTKEAATRDAGAMLDFL